LEDLLPLFLVLVAGQIVLWFETGERLGTLI